MSSGLRAGMKAAASATRRRRFLAREAAELGAALERAAESKASVRVVLSGVWRGAGWRGRAEKPRIVGAGGRAGVGGSGGGGAMAEKGEDETRREQRDRQQGKAHSSCGACALVYEYAT